MYQNHLVHYLRIIQKIREAPQLSKQSRSAHERQHTLQIMIKIKITERKHENHDENHIFDYLYPTLQSPITHALYQFHCFPKNYCYV